MRPSFRTDLGLGAVCGLAASSVIWAVALDPPRLTPETVLLWGAAVVLGAMGTRRLYAVAFAALLIGGAGASVLAVAVGAAVALEGRHGADRSRALSEAGVRLTAAGVASGSFLLAAPAVPQGVAWVIHGAAWAATGSLLGLVAGAGPTRFRLSRAPATSGLAILSGAGLAFCLAQRPGAWPACALLLAAALPVGAARRRARCAERDARVVARRSTRCACQALADLLSARDARTRPHGERVQRLSVAVGRRLGLSRAELRSLRTAARLHDLGKPAGAGDPAERELVRAHPAVGAQILERLPGCEQAADIVRHHRERWDGTGYPCGLRGDAIPLGARILAAADNYDAWTSGHPDRPALQPVEALELLQREAGGMFDGWVVENLIQFLEEHPAPWTSPAVAAPSDGRPRDRIDARSGALPRAQLELQTLYEIARACEYGIALDDFLALAASKLAAVVPHAALVVYRLDERRRTLRARFATGPAAARMHALEVRLGDGLTGRSALERRALRASDPGSAFDRAGFRSDFAGHTDDPDLAELRAALAAPLAAGDRCVGVLTLYDRPGRRFTEHERRSLVDVAARIASAVAREASREFPRGKLTDPLTGVPNAEFLEVETSHRIAHATRGESGFGLLAFRVLGLDRVTEDLGHDASERIVARVARRFARACEPGDTLVRFGPDLFLVLTAADLPSQLARRWHGLSLEVERPLVFAAGRPVHQVRLAAAHAVHPADGATLTELLGALEERIVPLEGEGRRVVPFRVPAAG